MTTRYWHILGYDGLEKIYDRKVKVGYFSETRIRELLMALAARAGLNYDEIVGAYAARNAKIANVLLDVRKEGPYPDYTCGDNPYFVARVIKE